MTRHAPEPNAMWSKENHEEPTAHRPANRILEVELGTPQPGVPRFRE
jgi:hypothetical protein